MYGSEYIYHTARTRYASHRNTGLSQPHLHLLSGALGRPEVPRYLLLRQMPAVTGGTRVRQCQQGLLERVRAGRPERYEQLDDLVPVDGLVRGAPRPRRFRRRGRERAVYVRRGGGQQQQLG